MKSMFFGEGGLDGQEWGIVGVKRVQSLGEITWCMERDDGASVMAVPSNAATSLSLSLAFSKDAFCV